MGAKSGFALKLLQWFIRGVQFCCCAIVLALYSYFLATLVNHNLHVQTYIRAVEGISGVGVVYTAFGLLLLCCLAGHVFTSAISIFLDICFIGAFIYVAWTNRGGASSCTGYLDTPYGSGRSATDISGNTDGFTNLPSYHQACRMTSAVLAVSIVAIVFFLLSILMEIVLVRHHRKEKRFGPSPANNYTSGYGRGAGRGGFFSRFRRNRGASTAGDNAYNPNTLPEHTHPGDVRHSYATETTAVGDQRPSNTYNKYGDAGYDNQATAPQPNAGYRYGDGTYTA